MVFLGKINVLDKSIAELIAAGEVVERPASVIKELTENSIDAGATSITVEIKNGGIKYIRITDNGIGIMKEDVPRAFLRHATSKVVKADDLDNISTLGFRGEALASVCAVSKVQLLTKSANEDIGTLYEITEGNPVLYEDAGCPQGTTIIVRDLFYNVPARMKFLKTDVAEGNAVANVIDKIALSHSEISFIFIRDGKTVLRTSGDNNLKSTIYSVYGKEFTSKLIPVDYKLNGVEVNGYVTKPEFGRPNRNMQNFFINGRFVKSMTASKAIEEAFKGSIMVGKIPSCVLNIKIPFESIDVNVHPAKTEVRFVNERPVFDAIYHGVKSSLLKGDTVKEISLKPNDIVQHKQPNAFSFEKSPYAVKQEKPKQLNFSDVGTFVQQKNKEKITEKIDYSNEPEIFIPSSKAFEKSEVKSTSSLNTEIPQIIKEEIINNPVEIVQNENLNKDNPNELKINKKDTKAEKKCGIIRESTPKKVETENVFNDENELKYLGEAFATYIIIQKGKDRIMFIDKHAAHERIIYEKLLGEKGKGFMQMLLAPVVVNLPKNEYNVIIENIEKLEEYNFDVDDFGNGKIAVRGIPQYIEHYCVEDIIIEIADNLIKKKIDINTEQMDWIFHSVSCRSAIKAGNINYENELMEIAKIVNSDEKIRYCPHGRPVSFVLTKKELEKQFGRV